MSNEKIYLASPHMSEQGYEREYIDEAFATNWIAPLGPNTNNFEREMEKKTGGKNAVALSSGTSAIHLALKAVGVEQGDIVFCQSLTFSATVNPIIYEKAIPVFIDSNYETWNMCPVALEKAFQKYPKVKAVIVVHLYGLSADLDKIKAICDKYNVSLIEDAAESLGGKYKGAQTGTIGEYGIFSFNGNKIITTSGGGMLLCPNEKIKKKIIFWATQSRDDEIHYEHNEVGYNYRMSNILAGIGRGQLKVLDERVSKKKHIFEYYKRELDSLENIDFMPINDWDEPNYWLSSITVSGGIKPIQIIEELGKENIESRPLWKPMHLQPIFSKYDIIGGEVSADLFERGLCLPSDTKMNDDDLARICSIIRKVLTR